VVGRERAGVPEEALGGGVLVERGLEVRHRPQKNEA
jgi:hypothetical protein